MSEEKRRKCPWCQKFIIPSKDEEGNLLCPECRNYIVLKSGDHTVEVRRPEDVAATPQEEAAELESEDVIPASELGIDDTLEVVSVEEASARCPIIIERWEWRQSQFRDEEGRQREYASMECVDKEGRRFVWNTSAWQPCHKLRVAEKEGKKRILVRKIEYDMRGGRPVNIRIR